MAATWFPYGMTLHTQTPRPPAAVLTVGRLAVSLPDHGPSCGIHGDPTASGRCASCDAGVPDPDPFVRLEPVTMGTFWRFVARAQSGHADYDRGIRDHATDARLSLGKGDAYGLAYWGARALTLSIASDHDMRFDRCDATDGHWEAFQRLAAALTGNARLVGDTEQWIAGNRRGKAMWLAATETQRHAEHPASWCASWRGVPFHFGPSGVVSWSTDAGWALLFSDGVASGDFTERSGGPGTFGHVDLVWANREGR